MVERSCLENRRGASHRGFESHPLRQLALAAIAALTLACTGPTYVAPEGRAEPRYLHAALPGMAEPLQVSDLTGSVVGVELDARTPTVGGRDETFLAGVAGRANVVLVGWPGGCEARADIGVDPASEAGGRPTFTLKLLPRPDPCAAALPRRVIVVFEGPVDAAGFNLDVVR